MMTEVISYLKNLCKQKNYLPLQVKVSQDKNKGWYVYARNWCIIQLDIFTSGNWKNLPSKKFKEIINQAMINHNGI